MSMAESPPFPEPTSGQPPKGGQIASVPEGAYPDFDFSFLKDQLTEQRVFELDDGMRASMVLHGIRNVLDLDPKDAQYTYRRGHVARVEKYLSQSVSIAGQSAPRRQRVDETYAQTALLEELATFNHPIVQALGTINKELGETLGAHTINRISRLVLINSHWSDLRETYDSQLAEAREAARPKKR